MVKDCDQKVLLQYMRSHIAKPSFFGDLAPPVCGFCGTLHTGNLRKVKARGKNKNKDIFKPEVDCTYNYKFSYASVIKNTVSNPSSNIPENCPICGSYIFDI